MSGTEGNDENSEFREAMGDVNPVADRDKLARPKTIRRRRKPRPDETTEAVAFEIDRIGERHEGIAPGVDHGLLRRLRNGEIQRDAKLDLHGLDAVSARRRVHEKLAEVHAAGGRCVLVVHGKGNRSTAGPVLKDALPVWLAEPALAPTVQAFASATGGDGGVGATYVLLRG
ncbi:MAG: Smr/MutS family protein [Deltaproteobacteria bacterium]|nr:Smr/MutS family protein [Deltaproteobacteria bacterium]MBW2359958.1 Smr/MutS family protein [Deltaproteobacteria bacterium]